MNQAQAIEPLVVIGPGSIPCPSEGGQSVARVVLEELRKHASPKPVHRQPFRRPPKRKGKPPQEEQPG